jgi:multicomponent Na+:H+ antiporter subunit E|tara:strand:+ start:2146 stop:2628 length:483 start_codon:yes stop_codon:yes gene_type:complete
MRTVLMGLVFFGIWLLWSGHYSFDHTLVFVLGAVSCAAVVFIIKRARIDDAEGHPIHLFGRALVYWPWLIWAIVKANIDVTLRILKPGLPISPTLVKVRPSQKTDLGRVIYANSITLTPGTVSVEMDEDTIVVHAISREGTEELKDGDMDRRVTAMEGQS